MALIFELKSWIKTPMVAQPRCIVRGSINCDEYFHVNHIVRPGETLSSKGHQRRVGGKGANQAVAIARAGGQVSFYGNVGEDGVWIKEAMGRWGIGTEGILVSEGSTGRAIIQVDKEGENSIILYPGTNHSTAHEANFKSESQSSDLGYFPPCSHLLLQNEIHLQSTLYALANARDATVFYNPSPLLPPGQVQAFPWDRVDWLVVNEDEARGLAVSLGCGSELTSMTTSDSVLETLLSHPTFERTNIVCTLGAQGVLVGLAHSNTTFSANINTNASPNNPSSNPSNPEDSSRTPPPAHTTTFKLIRVPAAQTLTPIKDTTGAGDTFMGYFVRGIMGLGPGARVWHDIQPDDIERVLGVCVQAAAMCVEKEGTIDSIPCVREVEERMAAVKSLKGL